MRPLEPAMSRSRKRGKYALAIQITIPSDLRLHSLALSDNVENPCGSSFAKIRRLWRAKPFRISAITPKFHILVAVPCGTPTALRTGEFQPQPLGIGPDCCQPSGCDTTIRNIFVNKKMHP